MPLVFSKLITNIIFSIYRTPLTLGLYILIIPLAMQTTLQLQLLQIQQKITIKSWRE